MPSRAAGGTTGAVPLPERPKLRTDIRFHKSQTTGKIQVVDPERGTFELYEIECRLASLLDGNRTINQLVAEAKKLGLPTDRASMESFLRELRGYGFLEGQYPSPRPISATASVAPAPPRPGEERLEHSTLIVLNRLEEWSPGSAPPPVPATIDAPPVVGSAETIDRLHAHNEVTATASKDVIAAAIAAADAVEAARSRTDASAATGDPFAGDEAAQAYAAQLDPEARAAYATEYTAAKAGVAQQQAQAAAPTPATDDLFAGDEAAQAYAAQLDPEARAAYAAEYAAAKAALAQQQAAQAVTSEGLSPADLAGEPAGGAINAIAVDRAEQAWTPPVERAKWRARLLAVGKTVAIVGGLTVAAAIIPYPLYITEKCVVVPAERAQVRTLVAGTLVEILHDEGDVVKKGEVIARIDDKDLVAKKASLAAGHERLVWELVKLRHGARSEEIARERKAVATKKTAVDFARQHAGRVHKLAADQVASQEQVDEADRDLAVKERDLAEETARLNLLLAGTRPEEISAKEAEVRNVEADQTFVATELERVVIRSPIDGIITTHRFRERLNEGVKLGDTVCEVVNPKTMRADILVPERELDVVADGQPVTLKVHAYPQRPFKGEVKFVAAAAESDPDGGKVVRVVSNIDNSESLLREDMTGYGEIRSGTRSILQLALRRVIRWVRVRFLI